MSIHDQPWPQGAPAWADLMVPDLAAAREFYGAVFGWEFSDWGPEQGHYTSALVDGHPAAGLYPAEAGVPQVQGTWVVYLSTTDAATHAQAATRAGAQMLFDPMPMGEHGVMTIGVDPAGAPFALWQAAGWIGAEVAHQHGAMTWHEHRSNQVETAREFYRELFGYEYADLDIPGMQYAIASTGGQSIGAITDGFEPARWEVTFAVDDADAVAARVQQHGGTVLQPATSTDQGRIAMLAGRFGETFSVNQGS